MSTIPNTVSVIYQPPLDGGAVKATDMSTLNLWEDWTGGSAGTSARVGRLGWFVNNIGTGATTYLTTGVFPHIGILNLQAGSTASGGQQLGFQEAGTNGVFGELGLNAGWKVVILFKLTQTTNTRMYLGFSDGALITAMLNQIQLRYDTQKGDSNFKFLCNNNGAVTATDSGIAADTNWHSITISSSVAGVITFQIDDNSPVDVSTNVPTTALNAQLMYSSATTNAVSSVQIDTWHFIATGLNR